MRQDASFVVQHEALNLLAPNLQGRSGEPYTASGTPLFHREFAALRAMSLRASGDSDSARALPPFAFVSGRLRSSSGGEPGRQPFRQVAARHDRPVARRDDTSPVEQRFELPTVVAGKDVDCAANMMPPMKTCGIVVSPVRSRRPCGCHRRARQPA